MAIPHRLNESLRRSLGERAAEDLVSWMDDVDSQRPDLAALRADIADLRQDVTERMTAMEKELKADMSMVRLDVRDARNEMIKWSFLFWIVTLGSLFLGRMLR